MHKKYAVSEEMRERKEERNRNTKNVSKELRMGFDCQSVSVCSAVSDNLTTSNKVANKGDNRGLGGK